MNIEVKKSDLILVGENETSKYWLKILIYIKNREIKNISVPMST